MYIDKATIDYGANVTEVSVGAGESMQITQFAPEGHSIYIGSDELRDIVQLAKLVGWEV